MSRAASPPIWHRQFDTAHDFPETPILRKYLICTSPRCGSHYLGHLLHRSGGFGYPLEYVNDANLGIWRERAAEAGSDDVLGYIKRIRTDPNGTFGIKVHYSQLARFLELEHDVLSYRFMILERHDLVSQAVSYAWAEQTGSWISEMPELDEARYEFGRISGKLAAISASNAGWRSFLAGIGARPMELIYEGVRADPALALARTAEHVGVRTSGASPAEAFQPRAQRSPAKAAWAARFRAEIRDNLTSQAAVSFGTLQPESPDTFARLKRMIKRMVWVGSPGRWRRLRLNCNDPRSQIGRTAQKK